MKRYTNNQKLSKTFATVGATTLLAFSIYGGATTAYATSFSEAPQRMIESQVQTTQAKGQNNAMTQADQKAMDQIAKLKAENPKDQAFIKGDVSEAQDGSVMAYWFPKTGVLRIDGTGVLSNQNLSSFYGQFYYDKDAKTQEIPTVLVCDALTLPENSSNLFSFFTSVPAPAGTNSNNVVLNPFINTSNVKNMSSIFGNCTGSPDITHWDTSNVTNMSNAFCGSSFDEFDVANWDVSNVTNMSETFAMISGNPDVSNWNVASLERMDGMFELASSNNPDVSKWRCPNVNNMLAAFASTGFDSATNLKNWDFIRQPVYANNMFQLSSIANVYVPFDILPVPKNYPESQALGIGLVDQFPYFYQNDSMESFTTTLNNFRLFTPLEESQASNNGLAVAFQKAVNYGLFKDGKLVRQYTEERSYLEPSMFENLPVKPQPTVLATTPGHTAPDLYTYKLTDAGLYPAQGQNQTFNVGSNPEAKSCISNIPTLPQGTKISWEKPVDTSDAQAGKTSPYNIIVNYPDGSKLTIPVKVTIQKPADTKPDQNQTNPENKDNQTPANPGQGKGTDKQTGDKTQPDDKTNPDDTKPVVNPGDTSSPDDKTGQTGDKDKGPDANQNQGKDEGKQPGGDAQPANPDGTKNPDQGDAGAGKGDVNKPDAGNTGTGDKQTQPEQQPQPQPTNPDQTGNKEKGPDANPNQGKDEGKQPGGDAQPANPGGNKNPDQGSAGAGKGDVNKPDAGDTGDTGKGDKEPQPELQPQPQPQPTNPNETGNKEKQPDANPNQGKDEGKQPGGDAQPANPDGNKNPDQGTAGAGNGDVNKPDTGDSGKGDKGPQPELQPQPQPQPTNPDQTGNKNQGSESTSAKDKDSDKTSDTGKASGSKTDNTSAPDKSSTDNTPSGNANPSDKPVVNPDQGKDNQGSGQNANGNNEGSKTQEGPSSSTSGQGATSHEGNKTEGSAPTASNNSGSKTQSQGTNHKIVPSTPATSDTSVWGVTGLMGIIGSILATLGFKTRKND